MSDIPSVTADYDLNQNIDDKPLMVMSVSMSRNPNSSARYTDVVPYSAALWRTHGFRVIVLAVTAEESIFKSEEGVSWLKLLDGATVIPVSAPTLESKARMAQFVPLFFPAWLPFKAHNQTRACVTTADLMVLDPAPYLPRAREGVTNLSDKGTVWVSNAKCCSDHAQVPLQTVCMSVGDWTEQLVVRYLTPSNFDGDPAAKSVLQLQTKPEFSDQRSLLHNCLAGAGGLNVAEIKSENAFLTKEQSAVETILRATKFADIVTKVNQHESYIKKNNNKNNDSSMLPVPKNFTCRELNFTKYDLNHPNCSIKPLTPQSLSSLNKTQCPATWVTGYFEIPSCRAAQVYHSWIKNLLAIKMCLVVYTDQPQLFAGQDPNSTVIIDIPLCAAAQHLGFTQMDWKLQFQKKCAHSEYKPDCSNSLSHSWIWSLKPLLLYSVAQANPYQSKHFFWIDAGFARDDKRFAGLDVRWHLATLPHHSGIFFELIRHFHHDDFFFRDDQCHVTSDITMTYLKDHFFSNLIRGHVAGGIFGGLYIGVRRFFQEFVRVQHEFHARGWFIGREELIFNALCLETPRLCHLIPHDPLMHKWSWHSMLGALVTPNYKFKPIEMTNIFESKAPCFNKDQY